MHFPVWKVVTVVLGCVLGVLFAAPNLLNDRELAQLPAFLPHHKMNLGLDLQGGSHLLLEADIDTVLRERSQALVESVRTVMRRERIGYQDLGARGDAVSFTLTNAADADKARTELRRAEPDVVIDTQGNRLIVRYNDQATNARKNQVLEQSIEIVRRRVDELGTTEPTIQRQGDNRILVQVPGFNEPERLKTILGKTAKMNFQLVDVSTTAADARATGRIPPGDELLPEDASAQRDRNQPQQFYLVQRQIAVGGETLTDSQPSFRDGRPVVTFRFDSTGARKFADITKNNVGRPFAIVLDGKVISAPVIREPILGGSGEISGSFSTQEAKDLALLLRAGALPAPLQIVEQRTVGPDLGADSIAAGKIACVIGLVFVLAFMVIYYGLFGVFANIALVFNLAQIVALLSLLGGTLTLPGIAGIVLTMGMAVDANILIYERIREEQRLGRGPIAAVDAGFQRALATIIDSNMTHVIATAILFQFGSGPIRGFAITLLLGVLTTMFTATMTTRLIVTSWLRRTKPVRIPV